MIITVCISQEERESNWEDSRDSNEGSLPWAVGSEGKQQTRGGARGPATEGKCWSP